MDTCIVHIADMLYSIGPFILKIFLFFYLGKSACFSNIKFGIMVSLV